MSNGTPYEGSDIQKILEGIDRERESAGLTAPATAAPVTGMDPELAEAIGMGGGGEHWQLFGLPANVASIRIRGGTTTIGKQVSRFDLLEPPELERLQRALYAARLYPSTYYPTRTSKKHAVPNFGQPDEDSYDAYLKAVLQAARRELAQKVHGSPSTGRATTPDMQRYYEYEQPPEQLGGQVSGP